MVLKVYGSAISVSTCRIAAVLYEKRIHFELVEVDLMKREHKDPAYLEKQPFGQIPYIDDDGFILYESRAICRYLEDKFPNNSPNLIPTESKAKALFEQAASVELNNFDPYASAAVIEKLCKPYRGLTPDQAVFDGLIAQLSEKLDVYEKILSKQKYIGGNEFTLADIFHLSYGDFLAAAGSNVLTVESRPNVARWWKDITSRESWVVVKSGVIKSNV